MENIITYFKIAFAGVSAFFSYIWGGADILLKVLIILVVFDYITGILAAIYTKTLSSSVGFKGILKKIVILILVATAHWIGIVTGAESIRCVVISFYIANEGISILENGGRMDIPVLDKFKEILEQFKDKK